MEFNQQMPEDPKNWPQLVNSFLAIKPNSGRENSEELGSILTHLCQCSSRSWMSYDHRQDELLVHHCISGIVTPESSLVKLVASFLVSLLRRQGSVSLSSNVSDKAIIWLSTALKYHGNDTSKAEDILRALATVLRDAPDHTDDIYIGLAGNTGSLIQLLETSSPWICQAAAMHCLHLLTYASPEVVAEARHHGEEIFPAKVVSVIQRIVISILKRPLPDFESCPRKVYLRLIASSLSVLYNLVICAPGDVLGNIIVSACLPFVFYGLPGFSHKDIVHHTAESDVEISLSSGVESETTSRNYTNRNRRKRLRRKRAQPSRSVANSNVGLCPEVPLVEGSGLGFRGPPPAAALASVSLKPQWARGSNSSISDGQGRVSSGFNADSKGAVSETSLSSRPFEVTAGVSDRTSSSETDFSDLEGGGEKESTLMSRVRQCALQAINAVIDECKKAGKQNKFSYWPPLMCQTPSLMTSVLKDPSPAVRMASLQVINTFLLDSSQVLTLAVDNEGKGSSYTTLGHQLGSSVRELHRCLALALLSEKFPGALVRTLKTIELLVENVNYSKLKPGLLTKIVTHVKYFMRYKEAVVRANAFSVMVSVLMIKPQVAELRDLLLKYQTPAPPTLTAPPEVIPPAVVEEELPGEEDDEAEVELTNKMEIMTLLSEDEAEMAEDKKKAKSMVSWLIQRCVDSLLTPDHDAVRGIYIQVQLQSLKVLSALVSEHLSIVHQNLPLIQHVIAVCSDALVQASQAKFDSTLLETKKSRAELQECIDPSLMSPDPGVVVEHAYTLLGSLLGSVKAELDKGTDSCVSVEQVQQLWLWTLQGPLKCLLKMPYEGTAMHCERAKKQSSGDLLTSGTQTTSAEKSTLSWRNGDPECVDNREQVKEMVATATVLSHLSPQIFESLGEEWISCVILTVQWLVTNSDLDLRLAGVRIMAIIVSFPAVVSNPVGVSLLQATVITTSDILGQKESSVNRDRLLASWALANVSSVLELYSESWQRLEHESSNDLLPPALIARLLEVGISAYKDKDKIKPHGVRCVGNITSFLRREQATDANLSPLVAKAIDTLVLCASSGSNMKARWNACHALGNILSSGRLPIATMHWRSKVLTTLGSLVENFKNYKVRIQACGALCGLQCREDFGTEYLGIWRVLLHGLDNAQNITDYQEIRHRDELINQICQGICQVTCHLTLEDAGSLYEMLQLHQDVLMPLLSKAHRSLPPERTVHAMQAHTRVEELLHCDALTEAQEQALLILQSLTDCHADVMM